MIKDEQKHRSKAAPKVEELPQPTLHELLNSVVDNPDAWLSTPSVQFGGRRPRELVGTTEESKIFDLLHAVDQGLF